jgi:protein-S-isoprenylcysteine O-methyltransferase Ste14
MEKMEERKRHSAHILAHIVLTVLIVAQIVFSFLLYNRAGIGIVRNVGWIVLWISAILGWLPILELRRKGKVPRGKSYVHTTRLVTTGVYAIVRHPQFLAGILLSLALMLIAQHWTVVMLSIPVVITFYVGVMEGDRSGVEQFGDDYEHYMQKVPGINLPKGLVGLVHRKEGK